MQVIEDVYPARTGGNMRKNAIYILVVLLVMFAVTASAVQGPENPSVPSYRSSGSSGATTPVSGVGGGGLYRSPNPIDTSGNMVITGNVREGKSFRGTVPYRSSSDFGVTGGSSAGSLDSFIRDSAGSEDIGKFSGGYKPFYSPTQTTTTTRAGEKGVFAPPSQGQTRYYSDQFVPRVVDAPKSASPYDEYGLVKSRVPKADKGIGESVLSDAEKYLLGGKEVVTSLQTSPASDKFDFDAAQKLVAEKQKAELPLGEPQAEIAKSKEIVIAQQPMEPIVSEKQKTPLELAEEPQQVSKQAKIDVYEQMKAEAAMLLERYKAEHPEAAEGKPGEEQKVEKSVAERLQEIIEASAAAEAAMGKHQTFASYAKDKFNRFMREGETYLKEGKFYKASEAFSLASIYKPDDPLAFAGKSQALFGAGEYVSSSLFLARTINMFNEYALFDIDIESRFADRDKLEIRLKELSDWIEQSHAVELEFLAAYYYYQLGRIKEAATYIDSAYEKSPDFAPIVILKSAIDSRNK